MIDIQWDRKFEIGHERIDHEHRVFLDLIRNASLELDRHSPQEKILRLLQEVRKYAEFHFYSEENIMIDCAYPDYQNHKQEHDMLLSRLNDEFYSYKTGAVELEHVVNFMFEWFALHTTRRDLQLVNFIKGASHAEAESPAPSR